MATKVIMAGGDKPDTEQRGATAKTMITEKIVAKTEAELPRLT